jgi:myosin heavy subunit
MSGEDQSQEQVAQETTEQLDVKAVLEKLNQLEQTNARLLDESKEYKTKYKGLRTEVESKEKEKLEAQENWKELLEMERNRNFELQEKFKTTKKQTLKQKLNFEVARLAQGAYDINDIITSLPQDIIEIDEENLEIKNVDQAVAFVKEKKPYLFNSKHSTGMVDGRPKAESGHVSFDDLSSIEQDKLFKEALLKLG